MRFFRTLLQLAPGCLLAVAYERPLANKLYGVDIGHQQLHKSQMLDQLAAVTSSKSAPSVLPSALATTTFQLYQANNLPTSPAPPTACSNALTAGISCNASVQLMGANPFFDSPSLQAICTSACTSSLNSYRSAVVSGCGSYMIPGPNNVSYAPTLAIDTIIGPYQQQCLTDTSTGDFCNAVLPTYNTTSGVLGYPKNELCTSCVLGSLQNSLQSPLSFSPTLYNTLQSALGTCGSSFDNFNVTVTAATPLSTQGAGSVVTSSNLTFSPACYISGRNITTSGTNNTCDSIASQFSITPSDVLLNNPAISSLNCTAGFGAGIQLCLPKACTLYTVKANQTCDDVVDDITSQGLAGSNNVTFAQLLSFNPDLGSGCSNLGSKVGSQICISPHGGFPSIGSAPTDVSKPSPTITAQVPPPGQTAPGTTSACGAWYFVQPNNICVQVVLNNSITLDDFLTLNPEVNVNCTNLWADYYYCVAPFPPFVATTAPATITANATSFNFFSSALPTPSATTTDFFVPYPTVTGAPVPPNLAPGTLQFGCNYYYNVSTGDNCTAVENVFNITDSQFQAWNPGAVAHCPSLTADQSVCVLVFNTSATFAPAPTNVAPGTITTFCEEYYTVVSGDTCSIVESKNNITDADFHTWNPEILADCSNLALGEAYCIAMGNPSGSTSMPASPTTSFPVPTNVAPGTITSFCETYYTVVSGDTCNIVESKNNITDTQFRAWNPEITSDCTNLALGEAYCVAMANVTTTTTPGSGPSGPTTTTTSPSGLPTNIATGTWTNCTVYHTVVSGDSCTTIEANADIAIADFLKWNPEVTINCNIDLAEAYCVVGPSPCKTIHTVASGDFCFAIASDAGITVAQLTALNPFLDANCDLQVGWNLCVAAEA